jgi:hypothetical protein
MTQETSDKLLETVYQGKNAKQLRETLNNFNKGSLEYETTTVLIDEIADGKTFTLGES